MQAAPGFDSFRQMKAIRLLTFAEKSAMDFPLIDPVYVLEIAGTFTFAISGVTTAYDKRFDLMGVIIIAFVTAIGGGTVRDMMIGVEPVTWLTDANIVMTIAAAVVMSFFFLGRILKLKRTLFLFDTVGLGLFTVLGMERAFEMGLNPITAVIMGTVSAVFGGVLRDLLCGSIPLIFGGTIYAFNCVAGGFLYVGLLLAGVAKQPAMAAVVLSIITARTLAVKFNWSLPAIR